MLTAIINTTDHLINGCTRKTGYMQMPKVGNSLVSIIYVKFDNVDAGNYLRNNHLRN